MLDLAVASYSFHGLHAEGKMDVFNYLNLLRSRYGVRFADIWSGYLPSWEDDFISKVRSEMERNELTLANLCVDGPILWEDDADLREEHRQEMHKIIRAASRLGARSIRIDFGGKVGHTMSEEAFDYIVKTYKEYCKECYDLGMRIGPENHWGWDRVPEYLEKVRDAVDHPAYGHLYHLGSFHDEPERGEKVCLSYAMHTHIPADSIPYAKRIIRDLNNSGYKGVYSAEHHSAHLERERVDWQLASIRGIIAELETGNDDTDFFTKAYTGQNLED